MRPADGPSSGSVTLSRIRSLADYTIAMLESSFRKRHWRKSDLSRILLERPFPIFVASQPFDSYPQELCVRVTLNFVTETGGSPAMRGSITFLPDSDVIDDLCAVLTLLSRRLVSVVAKTREKHDDVHAARWWRPAPVGLAVPVGSFIRGVESHA
jgi:hypothetical protein